MEAVKVAEQPETAHVLVVTFFQLATCVCP